MTINRRRGCSARQDKDTITAITPLGWILIAILGCLLVIAMLSGCKAPTGPVIAPGGDVGAIEQVTYGLSPGQVTVEIVKQAHDAIRFAAIASAVVGLVLIFLVVDITLKDHWRAIIFFLGLAILAGTFIGYALLMTYPIWRR